MEISVIIPLFNAEKYIQQCLYSLLNQTIINNIEILVIDDHGTDKSVEIVNSIRNNHQFGSHILMYETPQNSGAWAARNLGISKAKGKWIAFVDADDWCEVSMYESLLRNAELDNADFAFCYAQKEFANGKIKKLSQPIIPNGRVSKDTRKLLLTSGVAYFWTGLYKKEFLIENNILFPKGKFSEDSYFWWHVVSCCKSISFVNELGYHYRIQQNSVSNIPDPDKHSKKQSMYNSLITMLKNNNLYDDYKEELDYLYIKKGLLIPILIYTINSPSFESNIVHSMISDSQKIGISLCNSYLQNDYKSKILLSLSKYTPKLLRFFLHLIVKKDPF